MKIYKSCTAGLSDKAFEIDTHGVTSFISFERLLKVGINAGIGIRSTERIRGMVIDYDGITVYLETIK